MTIQISDVRRIFPPDRHRLAMLTHIIAHGCRNDVGGIFVFWQGAPCRLQVSVIRVLDRFKQVRANADPVVLQVGNKRGADLCPVFVGDSNAARQGANGRRRRKHRESRSEQKKPDPMLRIPGDNFRQDRKRRIINHGAILRIRIILIIAAGIKRPHKTAFCYPIFLFNPPGNSIINELRRIAIVRGFLCLELVQKLVVFVVSLLPAGTVAVFAIKKTGTIPRAEIKHQPGQVDSVYLQPCDLLLQLPEIPRRQLSRPVVPDCVIPPLNLRHMIQPDARDLVQAHLQRGDLPPVTLDNDVLITPDADRIVEPVRRDAGLDLFDVLRVVPPRIVLVRRQLLRSKVNDLQLHLLSSHNK